MGVTEEGGRVATATVDAMKSVPLAIALLVVNAGFLAFSGYFLSQVAANASARDKAQTELISTLVTKVAERDCRAPTRTGMRSILYQNSLTPNELDLK